jgi:hypothetical protein
MPIFPVRLLIHALTKRPCAHFRSLTTSTALFNSSTVSTRYQRQLTKREVNIYKQSIQRHMAAPFNDETIEKLLEPFRAAVKIQV